MAFVDRLKRLFGLRRPNPLRRVDEPTELTVFGTVKPGATLRSPISPRSGVVMRWRFGGQDDLGPRPRDPLVDPTDDFEHDFEVFLSVAYTVDVDGDELEVPRFGTEVRFPFVTGVPFNQKWPDEFGAMPTGLGLDQVQECVLGVGDRVKISAMMDVAERTHTDGYRQRTTERRWIVRPDLGPATVEYRPERGLLRGWAGSGKG